MEIKDSLISAGLAEKMNRQFIGTSRQIKEIAQLALAAATYPDTCVLITGESGTGKDIVARMIHFSSTRAENTFGVVSSSTITESLLESLFSGRKNGSFTRALAEKVEFLAITDGGTLFLDEIADMPFITQLKLLHVIEEMDVIQSRHLPLVSPDFRIISSTNRDPDRLVEEKRLLPELLDHLRTIHIHIPPLRERPEDIAPLLIFFAGRFAMQFNKPIPLLSNETAESLMKYNFPGNVRELKNMTERAIILCKDNLLKPGDLLFEPTSGSQASNSTISSPERNQEKELILRALKSYGFNQTTTAAALGMSRDTLARKMKKYHIS